jgi:membrane protein
MPDLGRVTAQAKLRVEKARADHGVVDIAVRTFKRFSEDDGGFYAAALTYYLFFSLFPLLIFATAALGFATELVPGLKEDVLAQSFEEFPLLSDVVTPAFLDRIQDVAGGLALLSIVLALYSGTGAVTALAHALNKIHRVQEEGNFLVKRLDALKWLALFSLIVLGSLAVGWLAALAPGLLGTWLGHAVGAALNLAIFLSAFKFLPHAKRAWRDVLPGAVIAAIVSEALKFAGELYLDRGASARSATFGAFATAAGLLVASYLLAQVTLLAAEVNAVLAERRLTRQSLVEGRGAASGGPQT